MDKSTPAKPKKHYWGILSPLNVDQPIIFSGSYAECWKQFIELFYSRRLSDISRAGIKITRIN